MFVYCQIFRCHQSYYFVHCLKVVQQEFWEGKFHVWFLTHCEALWIGEWRRRRRSGKWPKRWLSGGKHMTSVSLFQCHSFSSSGPRRSSGAQEKKIFNSWKIVTIYNPAKSFSDISFQFSYFQKNCEITLE